MGDLEKNIYVSNLFDFYKNLLTEKQQSIFISYYFNDIGLSEIAQTKGISRQAVLDSLKKTETLLNSYEEKLRLNQIYNEQKKIIKKIENSKNLDKINDIIRLWED